MLDYVVSALRQNPELAIFLTIATGFLVGPLKFGRFSLGTVVGSLLAGVPAGDPDTGAGEDDLLDLFLFTTGYRVGPQFFRALKGEAGTITAALRAVEDEAQSSVPALGYTVPYAVGNILLTAWGPVLVAMMSF